MTRTIVTLRAAATAEPRRHATCFLQGGRYLLSLIKPGGKPSDDDCAAWTAWRPLQDRPWLNEFSLWTPGLAPIDFRGGRFGSKDAAIDAFNALDEDARSFVIASHPGHGRPVMFYIHDDNDRDNSGGLTIAIDRVE